MKCGGFCPLRRLGLLVIHHDLHPRASVVIVLVDRKNRHLVNDSSVNKTWKIIKIIKSLFFLYEIFKNSFNKSSRELLLN